MRCTSRSATSVSFSPTPTLRTLPGAASTVLASCPGDARCFRGFLHKKMFRPQVSIRTYIYISGCVQTESKIENENRNEKKTGRWLAPGLYMFPFVFFVPRKSTISDLLPNQKVER